MTRRLYLDPNLQLIFAVTLLAVMGVSTIAPVFPEVSRSLDVPPHLVGLLITVFTLPGIVLTPIMGILADRFGRKQVLVPSLLLFALAGGACSLARDFQLLLLLRFFQGMGAASLGSLNVTLIGDLFPPGERTAAMGYNASVLSMGTAAYPALGGTLALLGWHVPFALPFLGLFVALAVVARLDTVEMPARAALRTYLRGAVRGMGQRRVVGLFLISAVTFVILYGAYLLFIPLLLEARFGSTPLVIGLIMSIGSLSTALTAARLGALARVSSEETLITTAFLLYGLSMAVVPWVPYEWLMLAPVALFGFAQGINYPSVQTLLAGLAPTEQRGVFMSMNGMVLRLGQTLGPVIMAGAFAWGGMPVVFYLATALCLAVFLVIPVLLGTRPAAGG